MVNKFFIFLIFILLISCQKDKKTDTPISSLEIVWKVESPCSSLAANFEPVFYKNKIITAWSSYNAQDSTCGNAPVIAYDKKTGEELWRWTDYREVGEDFTFWTEKYMYENILVFVTEKRTIYAIDMDAGTTLWSIVPDETGANRVTGIENNVFYFSVSGSGEYGYGVIGRVNKIDLYTGDVNIMQEFNYENSVFTVGGHKSNPYYNDDGEILLFTAHSKYDRVADSLTNINTVFNFTQNELIFQSEDGIILSGPRTEFYEDNIYGVGFDSTNGYSIVKIEPTNYEIEWVQETPQGLDYMLFSDGYIYHGTEGDNPKTIKRSSITGEKIWEGEGSNFTSWISKFEKYLYISNGGLAVLNSDSGETVLNFNSPNAETIEGTFFSQGMSIDQETGRIYIGDYKSLFCYEPYGH